MFSCGKYTLSAALPPMLSFKDIFLSRVARIAGCSLSAVFHEVEEQAGSWHRRVSLTLVTLALEVYGKVKTTDFCPG